MFYIDFETDFFSGKNHPRPYHAPIVSPSPDSSM